MFTWPKLELTDYERLWVRPYACEDKGPDGTKRRYPGVLRRAYPRIISNDTDVAEPGAQIQIARRSRVLGITFSGDIASTRLQITNASGTTFTVPDQRTGNQPVVAALIAGSTYMFGAAIGEGRFTDVDVTGGGTVRLDSHGQSAPFLIEPNWVLTPNETLIFNGTFLNTDPQEPEVRVLRMLIHAWEFPGMGNADKATREVM